MKKEKIKVYLYTRVSTTMQIDGYSLDAQKTKMKAFCDYNEYEIAGEYEDAGKSGKSIEGRASFNQMMEDAKHIAQNSSFKKVFAIGVSGDEKHHKITPLYVDDREGYIELEDVESFTMFNRLNIYEYYLRNVLKEKTDVEKTTEQILKDASTLHEYLRTYGSLKDQDKPLVVSGILLALDEIESGRFSIDSLTGDNLDTDGEKIYNAKCCD